MAKSYAEKLKDPRWQKKRLEVLERDGWSCRSCDKKDVTLHVHHCEYRKGASPWDYAASSLVTLCEHCHKRIESELHDVRLCLSKLPICTVQRIVSMLDDLQYLNSEYADLIVTSMENAVNVTRRAFEMGFERGEGHAVEIAEATSATRKRLPSFNDIDDPFA